MAQLANPVGELVGGQQQLQLCQAGELQSPETPGGGRVVQVAGHRPLALAVHREAFAAALAGGSEQPLHRHSGSGIESIAKTIVIMGSGNCDAEAAIVGDLQRLAASSVEQLFGR